MTDLEQRLVLEELLFQGIPFSEARGWIQKAIKHPNKLRDDLGLSKDENIYDVPISKIKAYAAKSPENKKRILFLRTLMKIRPGIKNPKEMEFFNKLWSMKI